MKESSENQKGNSDDIRIDIRAELDKMQMLLDDLKIRFEQYFAGVVTIAPDKIHNELKNLLRKLRKAPYKSSAMVYRMRALEARYNTLNTYWQRVLREREDGTYSKDVFKANLRERAALEETRAGTQKGKAEKGMQNLFDSYRNALEKQTGKKHNLDYEAFQKSLVQRAKDFKTQHGAKKLSFSVVVKDGKVTVQAKAKS